MFSKPLLSRSVLKNRNQTISWFFKAVFYSQNQGNVKNTFGFHFFVMKNKKNTKTTKLGEFTKHRSGIPVLKNCFRDQFLKTRTKDALKAKKKKKRIIFYYIQLLFFFLINNLIIPRFLESPRSWLGRENEMMCVIH